MRRWADARRVAVFFALGAALRLVTAAEADSGERPVLRVVVPLGGDPRAAVDEALLVDEALGRGAALVDPVVRDRTLSAAHALGLDDAQALARAVALGLPAADPVARQRLRFHGEASLVAPVRPDDATLAAYVHAHAARYRAADRYALEHALVREPAALATRLAEARAGHVRSDASLLPRRVAHASLDELRGRFGDPVARAVEAAPVGVWVTARSPFGGHLVRVVARQPGALPSLEALRARATADWQASTRSQRLAAALAARRAERAVELVLESAAP